jgi:hypothetical protein
VELTARQCLSGGDYELLSRFNSSFTPNPDFWVVYLFKQLIGKTPGGAKVYPVSHSTSYDTSGVRVFAFSFSGIGSVASTTSPQTTGNDPLALLAINLQLTTSVAITLLGPGTQGERLEYHLTGNLTLPHGDFSCNGRELKMDPTTFAPPPIPGLGVKAPAGSILTLAPSSIVFITL